jgi:chemotaxis-related protein WspD
MSNSSAGAPGVSPSPLPLASTDCWNQIGINGDRSCPELQTQIHCRNCPVFASAARTFFDRSAPDEYLTEWTQWLSGAGGRQTAAADLLEGEEGTRVSVLIFRIGDEWLAIRTPTVSEVTLPRPLHRIPHRSNAVLLGLVNLRGQLQLCISLRSLLGIEAANGQVEVTAASTEKQADGSRDAAAAAGTRLVVIRDRDRSEIWVFPADEVLGVHRLPRAKLRSVSSSLANPEVSFSQAILSWQDRSVSFLDESRIFAALRSLDQ